MRQSNFRLICATNRDLLSDTKHGRFRLDLYYRVNVFPLYLPTLKELDLDMEGLTLHLLASLNYTDVEIQPEVWRLLRSYDWPGNIRELKNILERGMMLSGGNILKPSHFISLDLQTHEDRSETQKSSIEIAEMLHIKRIMEQSGWDISAAAKILGISRPTLYRRVKKYNIIRK